MSNGATAVSSGIAGISSAAAWAAFGGGIVGVVGAGLVLAAAALDIYDALGPGRRHAKKIKKLLKQRAESLESLTRSQVEFEHSRESVMDNLFLGLEESAAAGRLILHASPS